MRYAPGGDVGSVGGAEAPTAWRMIEAKSVGASAPPTFAPAAMLVVALLLAACTVPRTHDATLWTALGEGPGVARIVDGVIRRAHDDPRIADLFAETNDAYLKARLIEQICALSGGGCEYTGLPMDEAHSGMQITRAEFNWFVEHTRDAMAEAGTPIAAQNRLLALFAPMHADIVGQ